MAVIKGNAYGHGLSEIARLCETNDDVNRVCVANLKEALVLIQQKFSKPVLILSYYELDQKLIAGAVSSRRPQVSFSLYTIRQAKFLNQVGKKLGKKVSVHLKIDIGTSRIGILPNELEIFLKSIAGYSFLSCEGIFSHFSSSEDDEQRTQEQMTTFNEVRKRLNKVKPPPILEHVACTAATMLFPNTHVTGVRIGLGLYGLNPSAKTRSVFSLQSVLSWRTSIIQVKNIPAGTTIGYGESYVTGRATTLAVIAVGYADGYDRWLSNCGVVLIRGQRCPVRGRVCMNMTMVDVTEVPGVSEGDRVTLIGTDRQQSISADDLCKFNKRINYEIVTNINPTIRRIVKE